MPPSAATRRYPVLVPGVVPVTGLVTGALPGGVTGAVTAVGVTAAELSDAVPAPTALMGATVNVYEVPLVRPVTTTESALAAAGRRMPTVALTPVGAPGAMAVAATT